jgi:YfiH family protein
MLQQRRAGNLLYYVSPLLERLKVPHGFSTRRGGVSPPPFDSLNLGIARDSKIKDAPANIEENYQRMASAIGCSDRKRAWISQVHGRDICEARAGQIFTNGNEADGLITADATRVLGVKYADCVPILLASGDGRVVAAIHAGWRGVLLGIVPAAVERVARVGKVPANMLAAAIGPCISQDAFEVGPEVVTSFEQLFDPASKTVHTAKGHVDLKQAVLHQLMTAGVLRDRIDTTDLCTFHTPEEFYSHRREGVATGRMAALISPAAPGI